MTLESLLARARGAAGRAREALELLVLPPATTADDPDSHYAVLGVDSEAGSEEIRRAYLELAARHHPDRLGSVHGEPSTDPMRRINQAYWVLREPTRRARYNIEKQRQNGWK